MTKSGQERTGGEGNFLVAMVFMALLFIPSLVYGQEVMRGVIQEKTDRVVEILVSSMTPMELLSGKILGMAAVGLTQIAVWMTMGGLLVGSGLSEAQAAGLDYFAETSVGDFVLGTIGPGARDAARGERWHMA